MSTDPDTILLESEDSMSKALEYLTKELKGLRTGRASPSLVEFIKVDYYGSPTDLKALAGISVPEPTQLLIKPFDVGATQEIKKAIEASGLGLVPVVESKQIRLNIPGLTRDRRQQLAGQARKVGEEQKIAMRNVRRDANKHADALAKQDGKHHSEDDIKQLKEEIQELLKAHEGKIDTAVAAKTTEILEV
jgi:ribosome recycling factor